MKQSGQKCIQIDLDVELINSDNLIQSPQSIDLPPYYSDRRNLIASENNPSFLKSFCQPVKLAEKRGDDIQVVQYQIGQPADQKKPKIMIKSNARSSKQVWKSKGLMILSFIRNAIKKFRNLSEIYQFRRISSDQLQLIGDFSSDYDFYYIQNLLQEQSTYLDRIAYNFKTIFNKFKSKIFGEQATDSQNLNKDPVIKPNSLFQIAWDCFIMLILLLNVFFIPIKMAFTKDFNLDDRYNLLLSSLPGYTFVLDMVVSSFTSYYDKGVLVEKLTSVFKHYFQDGFLWDFVVVGSFITGQITGIPWLNLFLLFRFQKLSRILDLIEENMRLSEKGTAIYHLIRLVLNIIFIAHFCGCAFYYIHQLELNSGIDQTWITSQSWSGCSGWIDCYIAALYWAVVTMITLGYGDIVPVNQEQRIFVIIVAMLACGVFAYSFNSIGNIFQMMEKKNIEFQKKIGILMKHLNKRTVERETQIKVIRYFEYLQDEEMEDNEAGEKLISQLNSELQNELLIDIYGKILKKNKMFGLNFSQKFLNALAITLKEKRYGPEEDIFVRGSRNQSCFFLMGGDVDLYLPHENGEKIILKSLKQGQVFGNYAFFSGNAEKYSCITQNVVSLVYLPRSEFLLILKNYPQDYEKFCCLRDNLCLNSRAQGLDLNCQICGRYTHNVECCPIVTYVPNKDQLLYNLNNFSADHDIRTPFERREFKSISPLLNLEDLHQCARDVLLQSSYFKTHTKFVENRVRHIEDFLIEHDQKLEQKYLLLQKMLQNQNERVDTQIASQWEYEKHEDELSLENNELFDSSHQNGSLILQKKNNYSNYQRQSSALNRKESQNYESESRQQPHSPTNHIHSPLRRQTIQPMLRLTNTPRPMGSDRRMPSDQEIAESKESEKEEETTSIFKHRKSTYQRPTMIQTKSTENPFSNFSLYQPETKQREERQNKENNMSPKIFATTQKRRSIHMNNINGNRRASIEEQIEQEEAEEKYTEMPFGLDEDKKLHQRSTFHVSSFQSNNQDEQLTMYDRHKIGSDQKQSEGANADQLKLIPKNAYHEYQSAAYEVIVIEKVRGSIPDFDVISFFEQYNPHNNFQDVLPKEDTLMQIKNQKQLKERGSMRVIIGGDQKFNRGSSKQNVFQLSSTKIPTFNNLNVESPERDKLTTLHSGQRKHFGMNTAIQQTLLVPDLNNDTPSNESPEMQSSKNDFK